ncbi:hypothetical protein [Paenibacillus dendritiformis]|uniref:hypothetical protein n=1 Tax=Paenibacillus dendritiformis TaxID=130049 RepID=UPI00387E1A37
MKEAIITDLEGRYIEPTLVADSVTGVLDRRERVELDEPGALPKPEPGQLDDGQEDEPETVLVGYTVAVPMPDGLYQPIFDVEGYRAAQEAYEAAYSEYLAALSEYPPQTINGSVYWRNGLTQEEIDALNRPSEPTELELIQKDNASLLMKVADLEIKNKNQSDDTASILLKNAELELKNEQQSTDMASVILQNAELIAQNQHLSQDYASLLLKLSEKGVL